MRYLFFINFVIKNCFKIVYRIIERLHHIHVASLLSICSIEEDCFSFPTGFVQISSVLSKQIQIFRNILNDGTTRIGRFLPLPFASFQRQNDLHDRGGIISCCGAARPGRPKVEYLPRVVFGARGNPFSPVFLKGGAKRATIGGSSPGRYV